MRDDQALSIYYDQFPWSNTREADLAKRFRHQVSYLYGRRHFIAPLSLFTILSLGAFWGLCRSAQFNAHVLKGEFVISKTAAAALLGAFLWCISDELARIVRRDLSPKDVYGWGFRILLSVPFGFAAAAVLTADVGVPVAFFLGAFPTQTLFTFARRIAVQKLAMGDQQSDSGLELQQLQSVSRGVAETFQDNGIETISALAWADPVDLTIRTNLDFNYVLDCMSQALLWVYFEDKTRILFRFSLRGSQEVLSLTNDLNGVLVPFDSTQVLTPKQSQAKATLSNIAGILNLTEAALLTTLLQSACDPYTTFINRVWR
ncbi:hypothetical protein [Granulicella tundricola]|nr:hypothetical protein [Granulicella tundricola]